MYVINGRLASDNPIIQDIQKYSDMWNALLSTLEKVDLPYFESRSLVGGIALTGRDYTKMLLSAFCAFRSKLMQKLFKTSDVLPDFYEDVLGCLDNLYFPNDDAADNVVEYLYSNMYSCITGNPLSDLFVRPVAKTPHVRPVNFSVGALYDYVEGFQGDFYDLFDDEELHGNVRITSRSILASLIDEDNDDSLDSILDSLENFLCGYYPVNTADCLVHGVFVTLPEGGCEEIKEWARDNLVQCRYSLSHLYVETKEGLYILQVSGFVEPSSYYLYGGFRELGYTHPIFFLTPSPFLNYAYELFGREKGWW